MQAHLYLGNNFKASFVKAIHHGSNVLRKSS